MNVMRLAKAQQEAMDTEPEAAEISEALGEKLPDWNRILRAGNEVYDLLQADGSKLPPEEYAQRQKALAARMTAMKRHWRKVGSVENGGWLLARSGETLETYSDRVGAVMLLEMMANYEHASARFAMGNGARSWTQVALALVRYRQERGEYPSELAALVPGYLPALPVADLHWTVRYQKAGSGFSLINDGETKNGREVITIGRLR